MMDGCGNSHGDLGMDLDYSDPGNVTISMAEYTKKVISEFPEKLPKCVESPADDNLFRMCDTDDPQCRPLSSERAEVFHRSVA